MTDRELMQQALDALEKLNKDGWILADFEDEVYASIEALRARLAQPEPEPICVAFIRTLVDIDKDGIETWKDEPIYATPIKREWQGLTDEEVIKLGKLDKDSDYFGLWYDFARAIEAKLKAKNA